MKKYSKLGWGILGVAVIFLAGCVAKNSQNQNNQGSTTTGDNQSQSMGATVKKSLYDLMTTGAGVKCTIDDPQSGQMTMFAKGDKAKVEGFSYTGGFSDPNSPTPPKAEKGSMINDGTWAYIWSGKQGMKFNIKEMQDLTPKDQNQSQNNSQSEAMDWKDWVKQMDADGTKYDCSPTVLSDSDFAPPSDVQFQDWGEMMKSLFKASEDMKNKIPGGAVPPSGANPIPGY